MDGGSQYEEKTSLLRRGTRTAGAPEGSPGPLAALGRRLEQAAVSASAAASQASANAAAEQQAQSDISTLEGSR